MAARAAGKLRVIGGQWRSRIIDFDAADGVRATPDRVRQTVYDWLQLNIHGARVLDLFAGSGAMGIEALSRGAAQCTFVDKGAAQIARIQNTLTTFKADPGSYLLQRQDSPLFLQHAAANGTPAFDVVLIDPPFDSALREQVLALLPPILRAHHRILLEWPSHSAPELPAGYTWLKQKQAGQVGYGLLTYSQP